MTELTVADLNSPTALKLKEINLARLEALRRQNDQHTLDENKTAQIRGRIAEVKKSLKQLGVKLDQLAPISENDDLKTPAISDQGLMAVDDDF